MLKGTVMGVGMKWELSGTTNHKERGSHISDGGILPRERHRNLEETGGVSRATEIGKVPCQEVVDHFFNRLQRQDTSW